MMMMMMMMMIMAYFGFPHNPNEGDIAVHAYGFIAALHCPGCAHVLSAG